MTTKKKRRQKNKTHGTWSMRVEKHIKNHRIIDEIEDENFQEMKHAPKFRKTNTCEPFCAF
jgi:hypothetical protein